VVFGKTHVVVHRPRLLEIRRFWRGSASTFRFKSHGSESPWEARAHRSGKALTTQHLKHVAEALAHGYGRFRSERGFEPVGGDPWQQPRDYFGHALDAAESGLERNEVERRRRRGADGQRRE
jgi:hypothetical protein